MAAWRNRSIRSTKPLAARWKAVAWYINAAHDGQVVEKQCFELPTLISGDGLRATERVIHPDSRALATVSAVISSRRMAPVQRVKRSTALRQYLEPSDVGSGLTIST
jgi:hypothetical protein